MDPNDIRSDTAGHIEWSDNGQFCYFKPASLPFDIQMNLTNRLFRTVSAISKLDGRITNLPKEERMTIMNSFAIKEATTSSAIEGSRSTISDIFREEKEKETDAERAMDNQEVRNYRDALMHGVHEIGKKGMTRELMLSMHKILMKGVRGENKQPGRYRDGQVWVGSSRDTIDTAQFVPVPSFAVPYLMDDLLNYMNGQYDDPITRIALSHYQFETIHPFTDGNGRMGRLIIMLLLFKEGLMSNPFLYLSEYFNRFRSEYIDCLMHVRIDGDVEKWVLFLLNALDSQVKRASNLIDSMESYRQMMRDLAFQTKNVEIDIIGGMIMRNPYITSVDVVEETGVTPPTARKLLGTLVSKGILKEVEGKRKGTLYKAADVLDMLEGL